MSANIKNINVLTWNIGTNGDYLQLEGSSKQYLERQEGRWGLSSQDPCTSQATFDQHLHQP